MTRDEEKLIAIHQLRTNMQLLDDSNLSQEKKNQALENLFDAYLQYQEVTEETPTAPIDELKKALTDSVSFNLDLKNLPQSQQKLEKIAHLLAYFDKNSALNNPSLFENITTLSQKISTAQKISEQLALMETQKPVIDQETINKLLKKATNHNKEEKEAANKQKTADKNMEKIKTFLEAAFAKKQETPSQKINLSRVEVKIEDGKKRLIITNDKQQSVRYAIYPYKKTEILGNDTSTANNMKTLLVLLEKDNPLTLNAQQQQEKQKVSKGYTFQNFCNDTGLTLSKSQAPDLADELKGYNTLLSQGDKSAIDLLQKLQNKYKYQTLLQEKSQAEQSIASLQSKTNKILTDIFSFIPSEDLLALSAPASAQNQDMLQHRQQFAEFIQLTCKPNTLQTARHKALDILRKEEIFWKNNNDEYYNLIKQCAEDPFYQTRAQQMFDSTKDPQEILTEATADLSSSDLAKKVLMRSVIVYGMGNVLRKPQPEKTNEILNTFGYQISLTPIKVKAKRKTTSKEITTIMRCLADGHSLEPEKQPIVCARLKLKEHQEELQKIFGKEKNYTLLVDNPLHLRTSHEKPELTPYQIHNMKLGLITALTPDIVKNIDFSEKIKRSLPETEQRQWDCDDYLFARYMSLYFDQKISPTDKELIKKLKNSYDWNGFKAQQAQSGREIYQDFTKINKKTETIIFSALTEGNLDECTQHHYMPLKFAVISDNPIKYNDTIITSAQTKYWQEDWHQLHHLSTIEGTDLVPSYCVEIDKKFERKDQTKLDIGQTVYFESLQVKSKDGQYHDIMPKGAFYLSSNGQAIQEPQPTSNALDFNNKKMQTTDLVR